MIFADIYMSSQTVSVIVFLLVLSILHMNIIFSAFVFLKGDLLWEVNSLEPQLVFVLIYDFLEQCLYHGAG